MITAAASADRLDPVAQPRALADYLQRLKDDPNDGQAWIHAARVMVQMNALDDAIEALRQGIALRTDDADLHAELGHTLSLADEPEMAEACYRKALRCDPHHTATLLRLGLMRLDADDLDEAGRCFIEVMRRDPTNGAATAGAALVLDKRGDSDEAWSLLQSTPAAPSVPLALACATVAQRVGSPRDALPIVKRQQRRASDHDLMMLWFAEGDLYDALGDTERAWRAWTEANRIQGLDFDIQAHERAMDTLGRVTRSLPEPTGPEDTRPVFVVGMPGSGVRLVESILAQHPDVAAAGELPALRDLAASIPFRVGTPGHYLRHVNELGILGPELGSAFQAALDAVDPDATRIVDRSRANVLHLALAAIIAPGARVIWCRRNPADVALSCFRKPLPPQMAWSGTIGGIDGFHRALDRLMLHWEGMLDLDVLRFDYEALIADPQAATRQLTEFLDLPTDPALSRVVEKRRVNRAKPYRPLLREARA